MTDVVFDKKTIPTTIPTTMGEDWRIKHTLHVTAPAAGRPLINRLGDRSAAILTASANTLQTLSRDMIVRSECGIHSGETDVSSCVQ